MLSGSPMASAVSFIARHGSRRQELWILRHFDDRVAVSRLSRDKHVLLALCLAPPFAGLPKYHSLRHGSSACPLYSDFSHKVHVSSRTSTRSCSTSASAEFLSKSPEAGVWHEARRRHTPVFPPRQQPEADRSRKRDRRPGQRLNMPSHETAVTTPS